MKKRYITAVCCLLAAVLTSLCASLQAQQQRLAEKLIRLHVVANSDTREDQRVKLLVRDAVLETADGLLRDAQNPEAALQTGLPELERAANEKLASLGCEETASVSLRRELFPMREYETFRLPAGVYRTLRVSIGQAGGHNWWCVLFPSLCFENATTATVPDESKAKLKNSLTREEYDSLEKPQHTKNDGKNTADVKIRCGIYDVFTNN